MNIVCSCYSISKNNDIKPEKKGILKKWLEKRITKKIKKLYSENEISKVVNRSSRLSIISLLVGFGGQGLAAATLSGVLWIGLVIATLIIGIFAILSAAKALKLIKNSDHPELYRKAKKKAIRSIWFAGLAILIAPLVTLFLLVVIGFGAV